MTRTQHTVILCISHLRLEAALHRKLYEVIKAALAFRMWGGRISIVSTHNSKGLFDDEPKKKTYIAATVGEFDITKSMGESSLPFISRTSERIRYYLGPNGQVAFEADQSLRSWTSYSLRWKARMVSQRQHDGFMYIVTATKALDMDDHAEGLQHALRRPEMTTIPILLVVPGESSSERIATLCRELKLHRYSNSIYFYFPEDTDRKRREQSLYEYWRSMWGADKYRLLRTK